MVLATVSSPLERSHDAVRRPISWSPLEPARGTASCRRPVRQFSSMARCWSSGQAITWPQTAPALLRATAQARLRSDCERARGLAGAVPRDSSENLSHGMPPLTREALYRPRVALLKNAPAVVCCRSTACAGPGHPAISSCVASLPSRPHRAAAARQGRTICGGQSPDGCAC